MRPKTNTHRHLGGAFRVHFLACRLFPIKGDYKAIGKIQCCSHENLRDNCKEHLNCNLNHFPEEESMSKKNIGFGLIIIGILILAGSLSADLLGLGSDTNTIGWLQWLGAGIGFIIAVVGVFLSLQRKKSKE